MTHVIMQQQLALSCMYYICNVCSIYRPALYYFGTSVHKENHVGRHSQHDNAAGGWMLHGTTLACHAILLVLRACLRHRPPTEDS
jgi:hypothetical protein